MRTARPARAPARCQRGAALLISRYSWTLLAPLGSNATLSDPTSPAPTFTPDVIGNYQLKLVVTNEVNQSSNPAYLTVRAQPCTVSQITNGPITATARDASGPALANDVNGNAIPNAGSRVTLSPHASVANYCGSVPVQPLEYTWAIVSRPAGSRAQLDDTGALSPKFVPDMVGACGANIPQIVSTLATQPPAAAPRRSARFRKRSPSPWPLRSRSEPASPRSRWLSTSARSAPASAWSRCAARPTSSCSRSRTWPSIPTRSTTNKPGSASTKARLEAAALLGGEVFALTFVGPSPDGEPLKQDVYELRHPRLGWGPMLLVPSGTREDGLHYYQALINHELPINR